MTAYPSTIADFTTKVDNTDYVLAAHVNDLQSEVRAIQTALGTYPDTTSATAMASLTFSNATSTAYGNVKTRLENIEAGLYKAINTNYVTKSGGDVITASTSATKGLVIKGASGQTANLQEWQTSAGTVGVYIDKDARLVDTATAADLNNLYVLSVVFG